MKAIDKDKNGLICLDEMATTFRDECQDGPVVVVAAVLRNVVNKFAHFNIFTSDFLFGLRTWIVQMTEKSRKKNFTTSFTLPFHVRPMF